MDRKQSLYYRYGRLQYLNKLGENKYDYVTNGILTKTLPKVLFKGNSVLVTFIQLIDMELITLMQIIKRIQDFKFISTY